MELYQVEGALYKAQGLGLRLKSLGLRIQGVRLRFQVSSMGWLLVYFSSSVHEFPYNPPILRPLGSPLGLFRVHVE